MESNWRTVLADTLTGVSSYSSGPLDAGDVDKLLINVNASAASNIGSTFVRVNAVDANGNLSLVTTIHPSVGTSVSASVGPEFASPLFGDQIQVDLQIPDGDTLSAQISIKGMDSR